MNRKATLKDIAKDAGFSVTITSRALGNYGSVSPATRQVVLASAKKLGYKPNIIARSLRSGITKAIGIMVNSVTDSFWMTLFKGIEETLIKEGYQVFLCDGEDGDPEKERLNLEMLIERNVDGVILSPSVGTHEFLIELSQGGLPIVLIDTRITGHSGYSVTIENRVGAEKAVNHLVELGHRDIAIVHGGHFGATSEERLGGYLSTLKQHGIKVRRDLIRTGNYRQDVAKKAVDELLSLSSPPTAVFVCNESMTAGALQSLKEKRRRIPEDISIVGWDSPEWAGFMSPGLTVVDPGSRRMGVIASEMLLEQICGAGGIKCTGRNSIDREFAVVPELIVRESCRRTG